MTFSPRREITILRAGAALFMALMLSGCFAMGSPYKDDYSQVGLTTYEMGPVTMGLPDGWKPDMDNVSGDKVVAVFANEQNGGYGEVKCFSTLMNFQSMQNVGQSDAVIAAGASPMHVTGPWSLGSTKWSRTLDVYIGKITRKGQDVQVTSYAGYNINTPMSFCYAAMVVVVPEEIYDGKWVPVFAAMLDSVVTR